MTETALFGAKIVAPGEHLDSALIEQETHPLYSPMSLSELDMSGLANYNESTPLKPCFES